MRSTVMNLLQNEHKFGQYGCNKNPNFGFVYQGMIYCPETMKKRDNAKHSQLSSISKNHDDWRGFPLSMS